MLNDDNFVFVHNQWSFRIAPKLADLPSQDRIQNALAIANKLLSDYEAVKRLFWDTARLILPEAEEGEVAACIMGALGQGYEYFIGDNSDDVRCEPNFATGRHTIIFSAGEFMHFTEGDEDIAEFFILVKILHEICHSLTPNLVRRMLKYLKEIEEIEGLLSGQKRKSDVELSPVEITYEIDEDGDDYEDDEDCEVKDRTTKSNFGSAFEQHVFGGQVLMDLERRPRVRGYRRPMRLIVMNNLCDEPSDDPLNFQKYLVPRDYMSRLLTALRNWTPGTPLPSFSVPYDVNSPLPPERQSWYELIDVKQAGWLTEERDYEEAQACMGMRFTLRQGYLMKEFGIKF